MKEVDDVVATLRAFCDQAVKNRYPCRLCPEKVHLAGASADPVAGLIGDDPPNRGGQLLGYHLVQLIAFDYLLALALPGDEVTSLAQLIAQKGMLRQANVRRRIRDLDSRQGREDGPNRGAPSVAAKGLRCDPNLTLLCEVVESFLDLGERHPLTGRRVAGADNDVRVIDGENLIWLRFRRRDDGSADQRLHDLSRVKRRRHSLSLVG